MKFQFGNWTDVVCVGVSPEFEEWLNGQGLSVSVHGQTVTLSRSKFGPRPRNIKKSHSNYIRNITVPLDEVYGGGLRDLPRFCFIEMEVEPGAGGIVFDLPLAHELPEFNEKKSVLRNQPERAAELHDRDIAHRAASRERMAA